MESCRSNANDLADPAMSRSGSRTVSQPRVGENVRSHSSILIEKSAPRFMIFPFHRDWLQRIFENLSNAQCKSRCLSALIDATGPFGRHSHALSSHPKIRRKVSRRWLLLAGGLLSAAALLFIALWLNLRNVESYSEQTVLDEAIRFFDTDTPDSRIFIGRKISTQGIINSAGQYYYPRAYIGGKFAIS